jgi:hypothetical protein
MSVSEVATFGIQKQLLNERTESAEAHVLPKADMSFQTSAGDVVTLSFADEQGLSQPHSAVQFEDGQVVQEISSVAQAASTFSKVVEGDLNDLRKCRSCLRYRGNFLNHLAIFKLDCAMGLRKTLFISKAQSHNIPCTRLKGHIRLRKHMGFC